MQKNIERILLRCTLSTIESSMTQSFQPYSSCLSCHESCKNPQIPGFEASQWSFPRELSEKSLAPGVALRGSCQGPTGSPFGLIGKEGSKRNGGCGGKRKKIGKEEEAGGRWRQSWMARDRGAFSRIENEEGDDCEGSRVGNAAGKVAVTNPRRVIEVMSWPGFTLKHLTLLRLDSPAILCRAQELPAPPAHPLPFLFLGAQLPFPSLPARSTPTPGSLLPRTRKSYCKRRDKTLRGAAAFAPSTGSILSTPLSSLSVRSPVRIFLG